MGVSFRLLGPLQFDRGGEPVELPPGQLPQLLAVLLVHAGQEVAHETLTEVLWAVEPPPTARKLVQVRMSQLRRLLAGTAVQLTGSRTGYRLQIPPRSLDLHEFRALVDEAAGSDPAIAEERLREALNLWRGPALVEIGTTLRGERLATALREEHLAAVEAHADAALACGRHQEIVGRLTELLGDHPLRERLRVRLMLCMHRAGRKAEALALYDRGRQLLAEDLGQEPGAELRAAQQTVLAPEDDEREVVPAQLPLDLLGFAGRAPELDRLDELLSSAARHPSAVVISAVSGTAGVGKSVLAVHWAHRVAHRFPDGQLYVNLRGFDPLRPAMAPADAIRGFLDAFGVPPSHIPSDVDAQAAFYRSVVAERRVLIVLDNARDADQVRPLLPGAPGCLVVATSRGQLTSLVVVEAAQPLHLDLLTHPEARALLANRIGHDRVAAEPQAVDDIIVRCARLPLALAIVAARAAVNPGFALSALAAELGSGLDVFESGDPATSARAVFSWSCRTLGADAARLFRLLGLHPGPDIGLAAAASLAGVPAPAVRPLLGELAQAHLITEHSPGRYSFHDLLRAYAAELALSRDFADERQRASRRLLDHYLHTAHAADRQLRPHRVPVDLPPLGSCVEPEQFGSLAQALAWFTTERPVLLAAADHAVSSGFEAHAWQIALRLNDFLERHGHWHDQATVAATALKAAEVANDRKGRAHASYVLASAHVWLGRFGDALRLCRRALTLFDELGDHQGRGHVEMKLGIMFEQRDNRAEALLHTRRAIEAFDRAGNNVGQANALNNVGFLLAGDGNFGHALEACEKALSLLQEAGDRYGEANVWDSLGFVHHGLGNHTTAVSCYQRALGIWDEASESFYVADTLNHLAQTHLSAGEPAAAREAWQRALLILERLDHQDAEKIHEALARVNRCASAD